MRTSTARRSHGATVAVSATIAVLAVTAGVGVTALHRPAGASPAGAAARAGAPTDLVIGPTDGRAPVEVTLVLRPRDPAGLRSFIAASEARTIPGGFLSPAEFGARFGPTEATIQGIERTLAAAGLTVTASYPQRTAIRASGPAAAVERLFAVRLLDHRAVDGSGHATRYHAPLRGSTPTVPASLRRGVSAVTGLSDRPEAIPLHHLGEVPDGGLTPTEVAGAYDITPLQRSGVTGSGETIAVISYATFGDAELSAYDNHFGLSGPAVKRIEVGGGTTKVDVETDLDVEVLRAIAPEAQILNFEAPNGRASMGDVIDAIVADGRANVITDSWGFCAEPQDRAERVRDQRSIDAAVAKGISIFAASGDAGAYDCQRNDSSAVSPTVDWPASSPGVIGVGGTLLFLTKTGGYDREFSWQDVLSDAGGGGGYSPDEPRPSWQQGPGVLTSASTGKRQVPDVAGPADPASGFFIVAKGPDGQIGSFQVGGTSAAAPFWAASTALMEQYASQNGVHTLGFLGPALYAVAASTQRFPAFHDVTEGANRLYRCTAGWDAATGLGSPDVFGLARDLVARAKG